MNRDGGHILIDCLNKLGVEQFFGVPGTQSLYLYYCLNDSVVNNVVSSSELAAVFSAIGYFHTCGKTAAVTVIPGPGFTHALSGIAEAKDDSVPLLLLTFSQKNLPGNSFRFQEIELEKIGRSLAKDYFIIDQVDNIPSQIQAAYLSAVSGEPGPVIVEIDSSILREKYEDEFAVESVNESFDADSKIIESILNKIKKSELPLFFIGQGCRSSEIELNELVKKFNIPVIATASGRGIIDDNNPNLVCADFSLTGVDIINDLIEKSDLVIAVGCRFSHNGTAGFRLKIDESQLVHIDKSEDSLNVNYPASLALRWDAALFFRHLLNNAGEINTGWDEKYLNNYRNKIKKVKTEKYAGKFKLPGNGGGIEGFFRQLNAAMPHGTVVVTDSGMHQMLTRIYLELPSRGKLVIPTDYQSMGFGIPAAVGAMTGIDEYKKVIAIVGDGSVVLNGMEITTAAKENLPLVLIIFNDASLGLIKYQQMEHLDRIDSTDLYNPDFQLWAESLGADYHRLGGDMEKILISALNSNRLTVLELPLFFTSSMSGKSFIKRLAKSENPVVKNSYGLLRKIKNKLSGRG